MLRIHDIFVRSGSADPCLWLMDPERRCCQTGNPATSSAVYSTSEATDKIFRTQVWEALLRIHDILGRIQIRGCMPLTNGSESGSWIRILLFSSLPSRCQQKTIFCLFLFEGTFTSFFKDKKSKRSHKTVPVGIKFYLLYLHDDRRIRIRSRSGPLTNGSGSRRPKNIRIPRIRIRIGNTGERVYIWGSFWSVLDPDGIMKQECKNEGKKKKKKQIHGLKCWIFSFGGLRLIL